MFNKITSILLILTILGIPDALASKVQQQGIVTAADCASRSIANGVCLPLTDQIYDSTNGQQLSASISGGLLGGGGGGAAIELLSNTGFESGLSGYTASGGTTTTVTSGSNLIAGAKSASWTATASGQTFSSAAVVIKGLAGGSCSAQLYYLYSGTANDYKFQVVDGSANVLAVTNLAAQSLANTPVILTFPCGGSTTSTLTWQVKSNVSSPSALIMDTLHLGSLTVQQASQAQLYGQVKITGCSSNWVVASTSLADFPTQTGCSYSATGQASAPATNLPAIKFASLPAGTYVLKYEGQLGAVISSGATNAYYQFFDGTNRANEISTIGNSSTNVPAVYTSGIEQTITYSSAQTNVTLEIQGATDTAGSNNRIYGTTAQPGVISVYYFPSTTTSTVSVGQQPQSWSGFHNSSCGWQVTSGSGTFVDPPAASSSSCALVQRQSNNFGTVAPYGGSGTSALPGITFTPTTAATYYACANIDSYNSSTGGNGSYRLTDGTTTVNESAMTEGNTANVQFHLPLCGVYYASSTSPVTLKVQFEHASGNLGIGLASNASPVIEWSIINISSALNAAQFNGPGTYTSKSGTNAFHHESGAIACSSGTCSFVSGTGAAWVSSITRASTGQYTVNIAAGQFPTTAWCTATVYNASAVYPLFSQTGAGTGTAVGYTCRQAVSPNSFQDCDWNISCDGY